MTELLTRESILKSIEEEEYYIYNDKSIVNIIITLGYTQNGNIDIVENQWAYSDYWGYTTYNHFLNMPVEYSYYYNIGIIDR